jgi:hypothetical protein
LNNYEYTVDLVGNYSLYQHPAILVENRINGNRQSYGMSSGGSIFEGRFKDLYKYSYFGRANADIGTNELEVRILIENRPLYVKRFTAELTYHNINPIINLYDNMDSIVHLDKVYPEHAYAETTADFFTIRGTADNKEGSSLTVKVTREDNPEQAVSTLTVPIKELAFLADVPLPGEPGVYHITISSTLTFPRGTMETAVAKWYVRKLPQP